MVSKKTSGHAQDIKPLEKLQQQRSASYFFPVSQEQISDVRVGADSLKVHSCRLK